MAFLKKRIDVTITLGTGVFGNTPGSNSVTLTGYRVVMNMTAYFGNTQGQMQCKIYGLPLDMMAQLTTIGPINTQIRAQNTISIAVGNHDEALTTIFLGTIWTAWSDFQESPNVCLNVVSYSPMWAAVTPIGAASFQGTQSVETILNQIVSTMNIASPGQNLTLVNQGVNVNLTDTYLPGTGLNQIKLVAQAGRFAYRIDANGNAGNNMHTLVIWPIGQYTKDDIITLSPQTDPGLVGYPTFSSDGIVIKSTFVNLRQGQQVRVENSVIEQANSTWQAQNIVHNLESERPGGAWYTQFLGTRAFFT